MSSSAPDSHLYSVAPSSPFLPTLRNAILDGTLIGGVPIGHDWLRLAKTTIYVPTRRAARTLRSLFVEAMSGEAALLPIIRPLGDFDEEASFFDEATDRLADWPTISAMERLFGLQPLVEAWQSQLPAYFLARLEESETIMLPASRADAFWLARELASVMDSIETEGGNWQALHSLFDNTDLAEWWKVTAQFLQIIETYWPNQLQEMGRISSVEQRLINMDRERQRIEKADHLPGPIIAAGSTGSMPATARLLAAIAKRPEGAVVLPGLDFHMSEEIFSSLTLMQDDPTVLGHPQYGLRKLLATLGVPRDQVKELGLASEALQARDAVLSLALLPSEFTDQWHSSTAETASNIAKGALDHITWLEAKNEREEAATIALIMRRAIEDPQHTIALVTPDRTLGRRVATELSRFGIEADDSGGLPLPVTLQGSFLTLLARVAANGGDPLAFVALAKHGLMRCGHSRQAIIQKISDLETELLRGSIGRPVLGQLLPLLEERFEQNLNQPFRPEIAESLKDELRALATAMDEAALPITQAFAKGHVPFQQALTALVQTLENFARNDEDDLTHLYGGEAGEALSAFLTDMLEVGSDLVIEPYELPQVLEALIADRTVQPALGGHPRIHIWGTLEARLQTVDSIILGGLNEGSWPAGPKVGPFLSRIMQQEMALEPPERRIGLGAHDFQMAFGTAEVILSRAIRQEGAPAIAARWLQRLQTTIGKEAAKGLKNKGQIWLDQTRRLDLATPVPFVERPCPAPPLAARPKHYSVTEAETLRRDPYAIYVKKVLKIRPLDPLIRDPGPAERGTLIHALMELLVTKKVDIHAPHALDVLTTLAEALFKEARLPTDIARVWWPRIQLHLPHIIADERANQLPNPHAEIEARSIVLPGTDVALSGRADRIEISPLAHGPAYIIDYKTGSNPSKSQAQKLIAPQLPLLGYLLAQGAFKDLPKTMPSELIYSRFNADGTIKRELLSAGKSKSETVDIPALIERALFRFTQMLEHLAKEENGFISRNLPFKESDYSGDYDHLARILEWSAGDEKGEANE